MARLAKQCDPKLTGRSGHDRFQRVNQGLRRNHDDVVVDILPPEGDPDVAVLPEVQSSASDAHANQLRHVVNFLREEVALSYSQLRWVDGQGALVNYLIHIIGLK